MASPAPGPTNLGVAPNVGGLLCYVPCCIGLVFSLVAVIAEKQSRFLRFHAFQSLLVHAALIVIGLGLMFVGIVLAVANLGIISLLLHLVQVVVGLGALGLFIFLMIKANGGEEFTLPVVGEMARKWAQT
ncbi:MAG TPA: DUF4870 domain-containing protein [Vicinamibacteria bacterium]|nr:DUF4870 domain-containing protein [Vicinamibacteria bacterium]